MKKHVQKFLIGIMLALAFTACKKDKKNAVALTGAAFYMTPLETTTDSLPLKGEVVIVKDSTDGFEYPLLTDSAGRFALPGMNTEHVYRLSTRKEVDDDDEYKVVYAATQIVPGTDINNIRLSAQIDSASQPALLLSVRDVFNSKLSAARIFIYTSRVVAAADTGFVGLGAITKVTNSSGNTLFMKMPKDTFFVKGIFKADPVLDLRSDVMPLFLEKKFTDTAIVVK